MGKYFLPYLTQRRDIIVGQFRSRGWFPSIDAPAYSVMNTTVPSGLLLRVSAASTFYYTTDGSDPRLSDGSINPAAIVVTSSNGPSGPRTLITRGDRWRYFDLSVTAPGQAATPFADLVVTNDLAVKARAFNGTEWSALSENSLSVQRPRPDYAALRVAELMYAPPAPPASSPYCNDDFAWLELRNTSTAPLDLAGVRFAAGITHTFAPFVLASGARLVLAKNPAAFATRHATNNLTLVAWTSGNLARSGETLALVSPAASNILTFTYSQLWHPQTFNSGYSLVAVNLAAAEPLWSTALNWRPSRAASGTPGLPDAPAFTGTRITAEHRLLLDVVGLEGTIELWCSQDLITWSLCDPAAWSQMDGAFTIDLRHPSLPAGGCCFFQIRLLD